MSDVTVLGLGLMGSALARAYLHAGHVVTVWNRSEEKTEPLVADGAEGASDIATAVTASRVILICVDNYAVTQSFLNTEDIASQLTGRVIVQLSTGTPSGAREAATWFKERGADYIDGEILALPEEIGSEEAQILLAGPELAYDRIKPLQHVP